MQKILYLHYQNIYDMNNKKSTQPKTSFKQDNQKITMLCGALNIALAKMITDPETRESKGGTIDNGPYEGLYLNCLLNAMGQSSWDFPSICIAIGVDPAYIDYAPMHPGEYPLIVTVFQNWDQSITEDDLQFDT